MPDPTPVVAVLLLSATMTNRDGAPTSPAPQQPGPPQHLRCEYLTDPLGIDRTSPRLSWEMVDSRRGAMQTAYQILVADAPELLAADRGNLWDSGQVRSDQSVHVSYAGLPLKSRMQAWWKVRVWDKDGQPSPWSEPARWSMGLLNPTDWHASWIGEDRKSVV
jgi:alpha-L-rhamnosidase